MDFTTRTDAKTFVLNSGVNAWEWGGNSSADGFASWLWRNRSVVDPEDFDRELSEYLVSAGENPADYGLKNPAAVALGRKGGASKSSAKSTAARANGAKGGRPRKPLAE